MFRIEWLDGSIDFDCFIGLFKIVFFDSLAGKHIAEQPVETKQSLVEPLGVDIFGGLFEVAELLFPPLFIFFRKGFQEIILHSDLLFERSYHVPQLLIVSGVGADGF